MSSNVDIPARLGEIFDLTEDVPCTRSDGHHCRIHYDTDLCPSYAVSLAVDRLHRDLTGRWLAGTP